MSGCYIYGIAKLLNRLTEIFDALEAFQHTHDIVIVVEPGIVAVGVKSYGLVAELDIDLVCPSCHLDFNPCLVLERGSGNSDIARPSNHRNKATLVQHVLLDSLCQFRINENNDFGAFIGFPHAPPAISDFGNEATHPTCFRVWRKHDVRVDEFDFALFFSHG